VQRRVHVPDGLRREALAGAPAVVAEVRVQELDVMLREPLQEAVADAGHHVGADRHVVQLERALAQITGSSEPRQPLLEQVRPDGELGGRHVAPGVDELELPAELDLGCGLRCEPAVAVLGTVQVDDDRVPPDAAPGRDAT
jgi:hypothetical protein